MITKERLEELIEQGATIYWLYGKSIEKKVLKHKYHKFFIDTELNEYNEKLGIGIWKHKLSKLFETKEEAEWHKEFGNITRTITLKLPTWGEFHKKTYYGEHYGVIFQGQETGCFYQMCEHLNPNSITIYNMDSHDIIFSMPQTEENYILACKKCKELFLGGNNGI